MSIKAEIEKLIAKWHAVAHERRFVFDDGLSSSFITQCANELSALLVSREPQAEMDYDRFKASSPENARLLEQEEQKLAQAEASERLKELNGWRELGEEMGRVISLMPNELFKDWFPDWFGPRLFDLQVAGTPAPPVEPEFCRACGASIPPRFGEGTCPICEKE